MPVKGIPPAARAFRPELYFNDLHQIAFLKESISSGVNLFKDIFGYTPRAFVPSNGIFHPILEQTVAESGVKYIAVSHFNPVPDKNGNLKLKYYRMGKKSFHGINIITPIITRFKPA